MASDNTEFWNDPNARASGLSDVLNVRASQLAIFTVICYGVSSLYRRNTSRPTAKRMPASKRKQGKHGGEQNRKHIAHAFQRQPCSWKSLICASLLRMSDLMHKASNSLRDHANIRYERLGILRSLRLQTNAEDARKK